MTVPEVGVTAEPKVFIEGEGNRGSFVFTLSEPAPEGGLILNLGFFEEDGAGGDDTIELENIDSIEENALGLPSSITISEGATEAKLTLVSLGDEIPEDDESSTLFLLETPEYQVEPTASEATLIETDVPIVGLSVDAPTIDENGAGIFPEGAGNSASIVFNLSEPAPVGGLTLNIATFEQDGAAGDDTLETENIDSFSENALGLFNSVTISEGATEARLTFVSLGDDIPEGPEETTIFLIDAGGYTADPDASEATIIETDVEQPISDPLTVSLIPETLIATEGETFAWNFSLDQPAPAGGLSLFLPVTVNNDPAPGDVDYNIDGSSNISDFEFIVTNDVSVGFNITIAEGATEATLVSEAVVDDITEIDEIFTTVIADGENYRANPAQNQVTTILTELPVVSLTPEALTATEGETFAWNFSLNQAAPEGGLSLFLPVTVNNDPAPGDVEYNIDGSSNISDFEFIVTDDVSVGFNITIAEGATEATLVSEAVVDDLDEETEIFTTVIADGENYRANPAQNQVTTTLIDAPIDPSAAFGYTISDDTGEAYRINLETGETEALGNIPFGEEDDLEGLATIDNEVFAVSEANFGDGTLWSNIDSPPGTLIGNTGDREGTDAGAAYNPLDGLIYNIQSNIPGDDLGGGENDTVASWLYSIDPETAETNLISTSTGIFADGLAINSEGEAYASDFRETDSLYRVNLDDGSLELIGSLGLGDVTADSGLGFAPDGTLYALTENSNLYTLDSQTGAATLINSLTLDGTFLDDIDLGGLEGFTIAEEAFI